MSSVCMRACVYVPAYWCADIDECAGPIGDRCRQNGVCDGFDPPGSYTCICNEGFELNFEKDDCIGQSPNVDGHAYACRLKHSLFLVLLQNFVKC